MFSLLTFIPQVKSTTLNRYQTIESSGIYHDTPFKSVQMKQMLKFFHWTCHFEVLPLGFSSGHRKSAHSSSDQQVSTAHTIQSMLIENFVRLMPHKFLFSLICGLESRSRSIRLESNLEFRNIYHCTKFEQNWFINFPMHATESLFWCNLALKYCHGVTWIASTAHQISSWSAWQKCEKMKPRGFAFCWPLTLSQDQGHRKWYATVKVNGTYKQSMYARNLLKSLYVMSNVKGFALQNRQLIDWVYQLNWLHIFTCCSKKKKKKRKKKKKKKKRKL